MCARIPGLGRADAPWWPHGGPLDGTLGLDRCATPPGPGDGPGLGVDTLVQCTWRTGKARSYAGRQAEAVPAGTRCRNSRPEVRSATRSEAQALLQIGAAGRSICGTPGRAPSSVVRVVWRCPPTSRDDARRASSNRPHSPVGVSSGDVARPRAAPTCCLREPTSQWWVPSRSSRLPGRGPRRILQGAGLNDPERPNDARHPYATGGGAQDFCPSGWNRSAVGSGAPGTPVIPQVPNSSTAFRTDTSVLPSRCEHPVSTIRRLRPPSPLGRYRK